MKQETLRLGSRIFTFYYAKNLPVLVDVDGHFGVPYPLLRRFCPSLRSSISSEGRCFRQNKDPKRLYTFSVEQEVAKDYRKYGLLGESTSFFYLVLLEGITFLLSSRKNTNRAKKGWEDDTKRLQSTRDGILRYYPNREIEDVRLQKNRAESLSSEEGTNLTDFQFEVDKSLSGVLPRPLTTIDMSGDTPKARIFVYSDLHVIITYDIRNDSVLEVRIDDPKSPSYAVLVSDDLAFSLRVLKQALLPKGTHESKSGVNDKDVKVREALETKDAVTRAVRLGELVRKGYVTKEEIEVVCQVYNRGTKLSR